jgi:hypothetical protein
MEEGTMAEKRAQSYQQVDQILEMLEQIHSEAGSMCARVRALAGGTRYGTLAAIFAERQEAMASLVAESRTLLVDTTGMTWIQYVPTDGIDRALEAIKSGTRNPADLPGMVVTLQNEISSMLESVRGESPSAELDEFLETLAAREWAEAKAITEAQEDTDLGS